MPICPTSTYIPYTRSVLSKLQEAPASLDSRTLLLLLLLLFPPTSLAHQEVCDSFPKYCTIKYTLRFRKQSVYERTVCGVKKNE